MSKNIFIIGVGGTGVRCLESFIHMCAAGVFVGKDVHILALDTDFNNGNFTRSNSLFHLYDDLKGDKGAIEGICGAKIHWYQFSPHYEDKSGRSENDNKLSLLIRKSATQEQDEELAKLLFTEKVQSFDLAKGYRAQTHLGSMLMYNSIVQAYNDNNKSDMDKALSDFIDAMVKDTSARCFVVGSVFGGTGASSIPVIPQAMKDAVAKKGTVGGNLDHVAWGTSILLSYFTFDADDVNLVSKEKVVANAANFEINSQVALNYYLHDARVGQSYRNIYLLGAEGKKPKRTPKAGTNAKVAVGGSEQCNPVHYLEMFTVTAADHFFDSMQMNGTRYYYRTIEGLQEENASLSFRSVTNSTEKANDLAVGLLTLRTLAAEDVNNIQMTLKAIKDNKGSISDHVENVSSTALHEYLEQFNEWITQMWESVDKGNRLFFVSDVFTRKGQDFFDNVVNKAFAPAIVLQTSEFKGKQPFGTQNVGGLFSKHPSALPVLASKFESMENKDMSPAVLFANTVKNALKKAYQF